MRGVTKRLCGAWLILTLALAAGCGGGAGGSTAESNPTIGQESGLFEDVEPVEPAEPVDLNPQATEFPEFP